MKKARPKRLNISIILLKEKNLLASKLKLEIASLKNVLSKKKKLNPPQSGPLLRLQLLPSR